MERNGLEKEVARRRDGMNAMVEGVRQECGEKSEVVGAGLDGRLEWAIGKTV